MPVSHTLSQTPAPDKLPLIKVHAHLSNRKNGYARELCSQMS
jgi:hypothetical protein